MDGPRFSSNSLCNERISTDESINEKDEGTPGYAISWKSWSNKDAFKNSAALFGSRNRFQQKTERKDQLFRSISSNNNSTLAP